MNKTNHASWPAGRLCRTIPLLLLIACHGDEAKVAGPNDDILAQMYAGLPGGWSLNGAQRRTHWDFGRDLGNRHSGATSAYLRTRVSKPDSSDFVSLSQFLRADRFRGHRVRYSAFIRTLDVQGDGAALWLRADGPPGGTAFDNMSARPIVGTRDWNRFEIVLDIPASAIGLAFGFLLAGGGIAWVDDIAFEIVDSSVPVTAGPRDPATGQDSTRTADSYDRNPREGVNLDFEGPVLAENDTASINWLRSNTYALTTADPAAALDDLAPLRDLIGTTRVVALGEATHGTREFFQMKHRVFRYLVTQMGFTHFAMETPLPLALEVDRYVQTGQGDPVSLIKGMHAWMWSTEEVLALVRWMREWNASGGQPRVRFVGIDMQLPTAAIDSVVSFVSRMDNQAGSVVYEKYSCLRPYVFRAFTMDANYRALGEEAKETCRAAAVSVETLLSDRAPEWRPAVGDEAMGLVQRLARVVTQWEGIVHVSSPQGVFARDEGMAENATWWLDSTPQSRMMVWAHNGHVSRARRWMGSHLKRLLGADYLTVGLTFSRGSFNATTPITGPRLNSILSADVGSLEALFGKTGQARLLFDTRRLAHAGAPQSTIEDISMRSIGGIFDPGLSLTTYTTPVLLPDDFDLVIWFDEANASRLLTASSVSQRVGRN